ncbi:hypothetical protein BDZ91DRAFT_47826 [Kalaharituber pfeilii]|nr:hypothetical protein BDZ91DRAFT_47826 [Kalaharituber pfeilii]
MSHPNVHREGNIDASSIIRGSPPRSTARTSGNVLSFQCTGTAACNNVGSGNGQWEICLACEGRDNCVCSMDQQTNSCLSQQSQSWTSRHGSCTSNLYNDKCGCRSNKVSGIEPHSSGECKSASAKEESGSVVGMLVDFRNRSNTKLGSPPLCRDTVRSLGTSGITDPKNNSSISDTCGDCSLSSEQGGTKGQHSCMPAVPDEEQDILSTIAECVRKPKIYSYPKWAKFCHETGYAVIPLTHTSHPVRCSPKWATILAMRGLLDYSDALDWEAEVPHTIYVDDDIPDPRVRCSGPVAFVGGEDPDRGFVWVMEEVKKGDVAATGRLVTVDEIGTANLLLGDAEEAAANICSHVAEPLTRLSV